jgi:CheY-like chemotaxis protein
VLDGRLPVILLVEPDPFERLQLIRLLSDSGYGVRSVGQPDDALSIFVRDHRRIALVLWRARMLGVAGVQLRQAIHRIASGIPVLAIDQHTYGTYAGHCVDGASALAEILSRVRRYVPRSAAGGHELPAWSPSPPAPASSSADAFAWPMPDEEVARIESEFRRHAKRVSECSEYAEYSRYSDGADVDGGDDGYEAHDTDEADEIDGTPVGELPHLSTRHPTHVLATSATGPGRFQSVTTQDLRDYMAAERREHLSRQRLLAGIGVTIAATCVLAAIVFF